MADIQVLMSKVLKIIDGMIEHNHIVKNTLDDINKNLTNVISRHYQIHHTPFAVLDFPNESAYYEEMLADLINERTRPDIAVPTGVTLMRRSSYVIIRGDLPNNATIRFDSSRFAYLFINGEEYTGDYTAHLDDPNGFEKVVVFVYQTPYDSELKISGLLTIDYDDFPLKNAEIFTVVGSATTVQPDITDLLEDDSCQSLYVVGDYKWETAKYCPIRTLSVTGLLMMKDTYNCPNLENMFVPNTTNIYAKKVGTASYRNIDISNMTGNINDKAFLDSALHGHYDINNSGFIGNNAFSGCTGLTSVSIGNSVTSIGNNAFSGCTGLTSVSVSTGYHCDITYLQSSNALNWRCFLNVLENCAAVGENDRASGTMKFQVHSAVRTALTTAYNNNDEDAVAIYDLMSSKSITIST